VNSARNIALGQGHFGQKLVRERQDGIDLERLAGLERGLSGEFAAQKEAAGKEIGLCGVGGEAVLRGKGMARIVVALDVGIAEPEHVLWVDVGALDGCTSLFEEGQRLMRPAGAKETDAVHFDRLAIAGVLCDGLGEGLDGFGELFLLIEDNAAPVLDSRRFGGLGGQLVE
jgi:hypothetical protein